MNTALDPENRLMKLQLVGALCLSNLVETGDGESSRTELLERLQSAIQSARPIIREFAQDILDADLTR